MMMVIIFKEFSLKVKLRRTMEYLYSMMDHFIEERSKNQSFREKGYIVLNMV